MKKLGFLVFLLVFFMASVVFAQTGSISGKVTDENGASLSDVWITAWDFDTDEFVGNAQTDANGTYTISGLPSGEYRVDASGPGRVRKWYNNTLWYHEAQPVNVTASNDTPNINFTLEPGGTISGKLTDGQGNPLVNVSVFCERIDGPGAGGATSNADGNYTIDGLPFGKYIVRSPDRGGDNDDDFIMIYYNNKANRESADIVTISSESPDATGINFTLQIGGSISGHVFDIDNNPIANLHVYAEEYDTGEWRSGTYTNQDGSYILRGLPTGAYRIRTCAPCSDLAYRDKYYNDTTNWGDATPVSVTVPNDTPNINFTLEVIAVIAVSIKGDPDIGLGGINVVLHDSSGRLIDCQRWEKAPYIWDLNFYVSEDGNYTIKVYDPFLRYQYAEKIVNASLGSISHVDFQLAKYVPSGVNPPTIDKAMAFVMRYPWGEERIHLRAHISDDSGCQPACLKSVFVEDPAGDIHHLYYQKFENILSQCPTCGEFWWNSRDNELSNFHQIVGDYKFIAIDTDGNRDSLTISLPSYVENKLDIPVLNEVTGEVDPSNPLTLSWNPVSGAAAYKVLISQFGEPIYTDLTKNTYVDIPAGTLKPAAVYGWRVIAFDKDPSIGSPSYASLSTINGFYTTSEESTSMPLSVNIVPWIPGSPEAPHDAYPGRKTTLKAVAKGGVPPYTYIWDFGDGNDSGNLETDDPYNLEAIYQYNFSSDKEITATITVTDGNGETATANYPIKFWASPSRKIKVNVAIDDALWWLHKSMYRFRCGGIDYGLIGQGYYPAGITAMALQCFLLNGHRPDGNPNDPYVEDVNRAINYIKTQLYPICIGPETVAGVTRNPDSNGNGIGLYVKNGHRMYETGLVLMALSTTGDQDLKDIIQDIIDYLAYAQVEPDTGCGRGGWRYDANFPESDMSVTQFPLMGIEAAEQHLGSNVTIPAYVKEELKDNFLYYVQNKETGGFGYSSPDWWQNVAKTGSGIIGLALTGIPYTSARTTMALNFIDSNWYVATSTPNTSYNVGDFYAMYAVMKGMKSYARKGIDTTYIGSHNWYDEYSLWEINNQNEDGSWQSPVNSYGDVVDTPMGLLTLMPGIVKIGPVAVAKASPAEVGISEPVTFDHSSSFHPSSDHDITLYQWDFDGDGVIDASTDNPDETFTHSYEKSCIYTAVLKVTDDQDLTDTDSTIIKVGSPLPGDCDCSGQTEIHEVQDAINQFLGKSPIKPCCDLNGDGRVTIDEVQKVINAFLGIV
ncbi:MAG: carboxypeptidase regulatory-like domain-containing protein [Thermoplasmata archaeon]|nr:carboxypeptidase regulatory-like domain-containing protein [Thermoplasmata archaeon]